MWSATQKMIQYIMLESIKVKWTSFQLVCKLSVGAMLHFGESSVQKMQNSLWNQGLSHSCYHFRRLVLYPVELWARLNQTKKGNFRSDQWLQSLVFTLPWLHFGNILYCIATSGNGCGYKMVPSLWRCRWNSLPPHWIYEKTTSLARISVVS